MYIKKMKFSILAAAVALITMILAAACSSSDPEALNLPIKIKSGVMEPETIKVKQGDTQNPRRRKRRIPSSHLRYRIHYSDRHRNGLLLHRRSNRSVQNHLPSNV